MGSKYSRKNQNRPAKPAAAPKRVRTPLPEVPVSARASRGDTLRITATAWEDTIFPVALKFPPPLVDLASDPKAFHHHWQMLTYAFDLPDPADFPPFPEPLTDDELRLVRRYITVAETVAPYTVVSHKGGLSVNIKNGHTSYEAVKATDEVVVGFSVRFRQLHHSSAGDPDFSDVANIMEKHARKATDEFTDERLAILSQWRKARGKLMNRPIKNIIARDVLEKEGNVPDVGEFANYEGVNPTELISLFNYGEKIHFGKRSADYEKLAEDPFDHDWQEHAFMVSMLGLVHLYFGYSELMRHAAGFATVTTAKSA